ncbi:MAG TPA: ATP-binding protein [Planctomycetaceae bacterium]|nr:ATP-binding protein [Planctomycetaceae bacterium]
MFDHRLETRRQRIAWISFGVVLLLLLLLGWAAYRIPQSLAENTKQLRQDYEMLDALSAWRRDINEAETGQRGYLLTNNPQYLAPYQEALAELPVHFSRLKQQTADIPTLREKVERLERLAQAKLAELKHTIELSDQPDGLKEAFRIVARNEGNRLRAEIRGVSEEVLVVIRDRVDAAGQRVSDATDAAVWRVRVFVPIALLLSGVAGWSLTRSVSRVTQLEERFRSFVEMAPDAIVICNRDGTVLLVNSQTEQLFGRSRQELLGKAIDELVPEPVRERFTAERAAVLPDGAPKPFESTGLRGDGTEFPIEVRLGGIKFEEAPMLLGVFRDATERQEYERQLHDKNEELQQASTAKDSFLAAMSHELRTPLNAIIGFTGTLLMKLPGPLNADQEKQLQTIRTSARHLLSLINDLLDLAKIESGRIELYPVPLIVNHVVTDAAAALRPLADEKGLALEVDLPPRDVEWTFDQRALQQILLNLIGNAVKFTPEGEVRVELRAGAVGEIRFNVIDTGPGIPPETLERLFQRFSQGEGGTRHKIDGTGLGLYLSQRLAELLGGEITVESRPGQGSTFTLTLRRS